MRRRHLPRKVYLEREQRRLEELAKEQGFESFPDLLYDMYVVRKIAFLTIAEQLFTPVWTLRRKFDELGIPMRTKGGRNNVRFEVTAELAAQTAREGLTLTSLRLGVERGELEQRLKKWARENL